MIPDAIVEEVRLRADIVEIVGEHVALRRAGREFKGLCPFHHEKTPSFGVVPDRGFYKCFGCGESGDIFSFLMKHLGLSFVDAVKLVAARVGVEIPDRTERREDDPNRLLYEAVAFAEDWFHRTLVESPEGEKARKYLARRGVGEEAIERFRLGAAPDAWRALREAAHVHGIGVDVLLAAGLIKESDRGDEPYDRFRDRLIFPIAEANDRTIAFGGRLLGAGGSGAPKYLNSPETPIYHKGRVLYGLNWSRSAIRREGGVLVVEGYMDYVSLAARGIENVVAGMGTALTPEQANLIARYAGKAWLLYDSDAAGMRATFRSGDALLRAGVHPLVVTLPAGEDPDSLARSGGAAALKPLLGNAADVLERKLEILDARGYLDDIEGKRRALDRLLPTLRATVDATLRDLYIDIIEKRTGVQRETLERELAQPEPPVWQPQGRERRSTRIRPREPEVQIRRDEAERLLLLLMVREARWIEAVAAEVSPGDFRDPQYRRIFQALLEAYDEAEGPESVAGAAADRVPDEAWATLESIRKSQAEIIDGEATLRDSLADIKFSALSLRLEELDRILKTASDQEGMTLLREKSELEASLRGLRAGSYRFSPRYRRFARDRRPGPPPTHSTEGT